MRFLLGAPCAGKGTISRKLNLNIPIISAGELLRQQAKNNIKIREALQNGELISTEVTANLMIEKAKKHDFNVFFDGFPRTTEQAMFMKDFLQKNNIQNKGIFCIYSEFENLVTRTEKRAYCPLCETTFETHLNCCGHQTQRRSDDNIETFQKRYKYFSDTIDDVFKSLVGPVFFIHNPNNQMEVAVKQIQNIVKNQEQILSSEINS